MLDLSADQSAARWRPLSGPPPARAWRSGLAANPGAPAEVLGRLLEDGAEPGWLARRPELPAPVLEAARQHPQWTVRAALAERPGLPAPVLAALAGDRERRVRRAAASAAHRTALPPAALAELAADRDPDTRRRVPGCAGLPPELLVELAQDTSPLVRAAAVRADSWSRLPPRVRTSLRADRDPAVRAAVRRALRVERELPVSLAGYIAESDPARRERTAASAPLDRALGEWLVLDDDPRIRAAAAGNPHLPTDLALALAADPHESVRLAVSLRADLTEEQRSAVAYRLPDVPPELPWVARRAGDPAELLRLARSSHPLVRCAVASLERLPAEVVAVLAADVELMVRLALAEHCADAPGELLRSVYEQLLGPASLVADDRFAAPGLARWARRAEPALRLAALRDPAPEPEVLAALAADADPVVARAAAGDPRLPLRALLGALEPGAQPEAAAANPALPVPFMHRLLELS
ncbi:hypothetical protein [Kitasatospora phosalacinea]|uniref:hypothetical protein n=1 Tax=Kitasatospora phosalacinea TaxID=2065 RepID=UPI000B10960A|nr:hypothetical protein [Kitasatospora phosalacinea]